MSESLIPQIAGSTESTLSVTLGGNAAARGDPGTVTIAVSVVDIKLMIGVVYDAFSTSAGLYVGSTATIPSAGLALNCNQAWIISSQNYQHYILTVSTTGSSVNVCCRYYIRSYQTLDGGGFAVAFLT